MKNGVEKEYCDPDTRIALEEIGCPSNSLMRLHLYDVQKWLREEKDLYIEVIHTQINGVDIFNVHVSNSEFCIDSLFGKHSYEEALLAGIKIAIKILKDE